MDDKIIYGGGLLAACVFGFSQAGLGDALQNDLRPFDTVPASERQVYMDDIAGQFAEVFDVYTIEDEHVAIAGLSEFSAEGRTGTFVEVVRYQDALDRDGIKLVNTAFRSEPFCEQAEMELITEAGYHYDFSFMDTKGATIVAMTCAADRVEVERKPENLRGRIG